MSEIEVHWRRDYEGIARGWVFKPKVFMEKRGVRVSHLTVHLGSFNVRLSQVYELGWICLVGHCAFLDCITYIMGWEEIFESLGLPI